MHEETVFAERAHQAAASGYIMKSDGSRRLVEGVQQVLAGNMFFSDDMRSRLLGRAVAGSNAAVGMDALTDRDLDVFDRLGRGLSSREVAARLKLSTHTIAFYRDRLKTKLGMRSSAELLRKATAWVQSGGGDTLSGSGTRHAAAAPHGELTPPSTGV
jgi:DNA-binding NarL/FixJ family response regulator